MNSIENNKLIAKFMDRTPKTDGISWFDEKFKPLRYNTWNDIMPVFVKLRHMDVAYEMGSKKGVRIYTHPGDSQFKEDQSFDGTWTDGVDKDLLPIAIKALVEFIKWYNENRLK